MKSSKEVSISSVEETEKRLQLLYQITSQTKSSLNVQLNKALELTTNLLGMEIGIISSIAESTYTVRNFYPDDSGLEIGQVFELGNTYCSITLESQDIVAINHMKESEYERHPCYEAFSLESYIGIPISIDDELYGTINFSSSKQKEGGFIPSDYTLIKLLGEWAGATIKRVQIEETLTQSKERYKLLSSNSADLICLHDLEGNYEFISPSVENILGYSYKELLGRNHADLIHEEDLNFLTGDPYEVLKKEGVVTNTRYRIRNKQGEYIWFESSVKTVLDDSDNPIGLQSVSREVTERKRLETMFEQAQEMAHVGGWDFDLETGDLYWTDEVYRIHDKEIGSKVNVEEGVSYFPGEAKDKIESAIAETIETGNSYDLVLPFISEKGVKKWVRAIGKAQLQDGKAFSLSGTFQDVSSQVSYEKRIISQNEELLKLAETRDKIYSIIAHDLKGAFFGIRGMLGILEEELLDPTHDKKDSVGKLNLVHSSAVNSYDLLENLLEWIKVQNGDLYVEKKEVNLSKLISKSISVFESAAANKGVSIKSEIEDVSIQGNSNMLATVFRNLISNAIKYSNKGDEIFIKAKSLDRSVVISVKDHGVGMPDKIKNRLFDKDDRPQRRGTSYEKGTGLGLLLCNDLIEAHNGVISVNTKDGEGSEFIVSLPKG